MHELFGGVLSKSKKFSQHLFSRILGKLANTEIVWLKQVLIKAFNYYYPVVLEEAVETDSTGYKTFNDFFTRKLKEGRRFSRLCSESILSPVDGVVSATGTVQNNQVLQAKGKNYSINTLFCDEQEACIFQDAVFLTAYLAPSDYHRVHMPFSGKLRKVTYVPGYLYPVNPRTANKVDQLFAVNERVICYFDTLHGPAVLVLVGALIVSSIILHAIEWPAALGRHGVQHWEKFTKSSELMQGEELGYFALGSTVILLLPKGSTLEQGAPALNKVKAGDFLFKWA